MPLRLFRSFQPVCGDLGAGFLVQRVRIGEYVERAYLHDSRKLAGGARPVLLSESSQPPDVTHAGALS